MADKYLKAIKDGKVVAVGDDKSVTITGEPANTKIAKGAYKVAFDNTVDKSLSDIASELVDVPEFTTLPINVTGVSLDKETLEVEEGATAQLKATVAPANATNKGIAWASDNNAVATIKNGTVTGVKEGKANVAVHTNDGDKKAIAKIIVTAKPALAPEPPAEGE